MQRISATDDANAPDAAKPVLAGIKKNLGRVPNIFATVAHSPAALKALMGMFGSLEEGSLAGKPHEAIALRIGEVNGCRYCTAAHTAKATMAGAGVAEAIAWRKGESDDPRIKALLDLAASLNEKRGNISDDELAAARGAGLTDDEIVETPAIVACNIFTNSVNALVRTDLDFPAAPPLE